jgi:8-amino-7-oxononanoate synthase
MNYITNQLPSRIFTTNHEEYLWFSGTSYLGMPHHQGFRENFAKALTQYGMSWGSSRNNNIRLDIYEKAEIGLAKFANMPAALTVSSGMWAGQLVVNFLQKPDTKFFFAPKTHPALWNGASLQLEDWEKGLSYSEWALLIVEKVRDCTAKNIVICSDAVGSPYVEAFDFQWIDGLPEDKNITVVVDASHSFGIEASPQSVGRPSPLSRGEGAGAMMIFAPPLHGRGSRGDRRFGVRYIVTASLNKAMGMTGGVILSDSETISSIRQSPMFAGASPMMPALLETFVNSLDYFKEQQEKLSKNIAYFNSMIPQNSFLDSIENYPAYCTHQSGVHEFLKEHGIMTACFPYPTATDLPVTRLVISALHLEEDLQKVAGAILRKSSFRRATSV